MPVSEHGVPLSEADSVLDDWAVETGERGDDYWTEAAGKRWIWGRLRPIQHGITSRLMTEGVEKHQLGQQPLSKTKKSIAKSSGLQLLDAGSSSDGFPQQTIRHPSVPISWIPVSKAAASSVGPGTRPLRHDAGRGDGASTSAAQPSFRPEAAFCRLPERRLGSWVMGSSDCDFAPGALPCFLLF
ncbi:hypothetical protein XA68_13325 [Ophiocordyceps unilateralis]|uniref:Uncharacterized protein n=1 Tax=Ophiocordyceps unilateralis TaxID=268505 RepID=A0A2A9PBC5_OPHUN|nr:hypothetical protein XA68_13325 [Ophiocordyceps unilateralis]